MRPYRSIVMWEIIYTKQAKKHIDKIKKTHHRSIAKQVEHWVEAGIEKEDWFCPVCKNEPGYFKPNAETIEAMQDASAGVETTIEELFDGWVEPCEK